MIKWLIILVVLGVGGYFGWLYMHPEKRACARLVSDLCHKSGSPDADREKCEEMFKAVRDKAGDEAANNSAKCIADSDNCAGALGCVAGAAGKVGVGLFDQFWKGAEKAFTGDKK
jgi:predicted negative regulator of RcsB-dependent stress response